MKQSSDYGINKNDETSIKFSVLMNVYKNDDSEFFKEALESVVNQTVKPDEIVLVVDGPIPNSLESVIQEYGPLLKVIRLPNNVGLGMARRVGVENCSNELIAVMDADDISVPDRFEKQINCFINHPDISIVGGVIKEFVNSTDNIIGIRYVPSSDYEIKQYLKKRCPFNHMTVMFKASEVERAGGYLHWHYNEDYYLWIRMFQCGSIFLNLKDPLVYARVGPDFYRRRGGWKYFVSEMKLQKYMLNHQIINWGTFINNVLLRLILQVLLPNKFRGYIFKKFARKQ